jgi:hypothetical protein
MKSLQEIPATLKQKFLSKGTASTKSQVESAAAVSGDWLFATMAATCSDPTSLRMGVKMDVCAEDYDGSGVSSTYNKYTCTEDSSTGAIVVSRTSYTDSACTTGANVETPFNYVNTCVSGTTYFCSDSNDYTTAAGMNLVVSDYETAGECTTGDTSTIAAYSGISGCLDGVNFGGDSVTVYLTSDCSGSALFEFDYDSIYVNCQTSYDDDSPADDDGVIYDGMYSAYSWEGEDDVCFHVDSKINYKGVEYTYEELKAGKEPECTVPHSPSSKGVIISTSCDKTIRVTDTHLVATTKGFQLAYSLKAGDVMYGDYDDEKCVVKSVEKEKTTQQYFGLNCVHSEVLASGLRASTFGDFHTLPSWYMTYVGSVLGTDTASSLGEYIAEWYFQK